MINLQKADLPIPANIIGPPNLTPVSDMTRKNACKMPEQKVYRQGGPTGDRTLDLFYEVNIESDSPR